MKRFIGLLMTMVGAVACLWSGYYVLIGESTHRLLVYNDFALTAMTAGLIGAAVFTVGLLWQRD
jgi:hypothetical protein